MSRSIGLSDTVVLSAASAYPERAEEELPWHDRAAEALVARLWRPLSARVRDPARELERIVPLTSPFANDYSSATDDQLREAVRPLRAALRRRGFVPELVGQSFALVQEVATRTIGQRHYDVQLMGGWALLKGKLAEMATGEGKTLTATLAACTAALAGIPVHVITVNDYLAARDAEAMGPIYRFFGLTVGVVVQDTPPEARRHAYACDVTYCTNKDLAFDYLRDRVALGRSGGRLNMAVDALRRSGTQAPRLVLRGLHYGIVDEADSVFIDEARTPLILSSTVDTSHELEIFQTALEYARRLQHGEDFRLDERDRRIELTDMGKARVGELASGQADVWSSFRGREELVTQALSAMLLFLRDKQYVVTDGKIRIVDEFTGRVMPDRSWERGLHQMIEAKEGCELSARRETLARITYQRLFRRYMLLAGMTGTAREVAREVWSVYRLNTVTIPLNRPSRRRYFPGRLCATAAEKWGAVGATVRDVARAQGRPVLIGTRSVEASEQLSQVLSAAGIEHALLNAKQDKTEAAIVAEAGQAGRVTVATNMAGRGTDIRLGAGVAERGGLHVILTECHASGRVDRQLFGRGARQGDPGSCEMIVSLEDELFRVFAGPLAAVCRQSIGNGRRDVWLMRLLRSIAQMRAEFRDSRIRRDTLKQDTRLEKTLAFTGKPE
jgi:preprotein translocase subunit SecA